MELRDKLAPPIRVIIVAAVRLYRDGLASSLRTYQCLMVAGTACSRAEANLTIPLLRPDVVVIDIAIPEALELVRDLHIQVPVTRLLAFGVEDDVLSIVDCAEAGATSYVTLDASVDDFVKAIESTAVGELTCSPRMAAELFRWLGNRPESKELRPSASALLTSREREVLSFIAKGLSNKEIATVLSLSAATVKNHVHHLFEKLHVGSRAQAIAASHVPRERRQYSSEASRVRTA
jgi:two-component system nitrate/nitrite response regulator NarL